MNGSEPKIEIFKPFGEAFELMKRILFQPFDLKKWFVIGFAAWLAHVGSGGGFNFRWGDRDDLHGLNEFFGQIPNVMLIVGLCALATLVLVLAVVCAWLRARGRFMFIDCIVKNRGAIAEPWREFRKQGNSYFLFALLLGFIFFIVAALLALPLIIPAIQRASILRIVPDHLNFYVIAMIAGWGFAILLLIVAWALIANFMVPVMYRRRCGAYEAFRIVLSLIAAHPGEILLYCLFLVVLGIGTGVISCLAICLTCCIAALPYIGTVILLPVYLLFRAFSLCFLRQFGSDYDVWQLAPQAEPAPAGIPPPLQS